MIGLLLLAACPPQDRAWPGPAWDTGSGAPSVVFTFPDEGVLLADGESLSFQALVQDDSPLDSLEIAVLQDGEPLDPGLSSDGVLSWSTTVTPGSHSSSVTVTDPDGLQASAERGWAGADLPVVEILEPLTGAGLPQDSGWQLRLALSDDDGSTWTVTALLDGAVEAEQLLEAAAPLDRELTLDMPALGPGEHQVQATLTDGTATASDRITLYGT